MKTKQILILLFLALAGVPGYAQHFEWAVKYTGSDDMYNEKNDIISSVADSDGNVYILGKCSPDAIWSGVSVVPVTYPAQGNHGAVIAKIAPDGTVVWHRTICSPMVWPHRIVSVGDSAILVSVALALQNGMVYLDSIVPSVAGTLFDNDSLEIFDATVFIYLSLDGDLISHHFLQYVLLNAEGQPLTWNELSSGYLNSDQSPAYAVNVETFCVDDHGYVYTADIPYDFHQKITPPGDTSTMPVVYSVGNGLLSGIRLYVNGNYLASVMPQGQPQRWNSRLMKFAPDFSSLVHWNYIYKDEPHEDYYDDASYCIAPDHNGHIYYISNVERYGAVGPTCTFSLNDEHSSAITLNGYLRGILVKLDTTLKVVGHTLLHIENGENDNLHYHFSAVAFDSNSVFLCGNFHRLSSHEEDCSISTPDGTSLDILNRNFIIRFDTTLGVTQSYGIVNSSGRSWVGRVSLLASNNRIFFPTSFSTSVNWNGNRIDIETDHTSKGVHLFDYMCRPLDFIWLKFERGRLNSLALSDSALFISGMTKETVQLDDVTIYASGTSTAFVTKYVDTSFMHLYVPSSSAIPGREAPARRLRVYPNPSGGAAVSVQGEGVGAIGRADAFGSDGRAYALPVVGGRLLVGALPAGIYTLVVRTLDNRVFSTKFIKL